MIDQRGTLAVFPVNQTQNAGSHFKIGALYAFVAFFRFCHLKDGTVSSVPQGS